MKYELYLASESPRRRELLEQAGYKFQVDSVKLSEIINKNLNPPEAIMALAREKAEAFARAEGGRVLALAEITDAMVLTPVETGADDQKEGDEDYLDRLRALPQKDGD